MTPTGKDLFKWADYYLSLGFSVIPIKDGKLPAVAWKEFQTRKPTRQELMKWFFGTGWGMAIVCGNVSGNLVRLDFDDPSDYSSGICAKLPYPTFRSQRQGGGYGVLFRSTSPIPLLPQKTFAGYPKLEARGEGGITVVPPTPGYEWLSSNPPSSIPVVDGPALLKELFKFDLSNRDKLAKSVETSASDELSLLLQATTEGERSNNLVKIAGMLRARGIPIDTALVVMEHNFEEHWPHEGMGWDEARRVFEGAFKRYEHEGIRVNGRQALVSAEEDDEGEDVEATFIEDLKAPTDNAVLIEKLVLAGEAGNTVIAAPAKMGKTSLILDGCITATRGDLVWGLLKVSKPLRIAYIDQERKFDQIRENQILMSSVIGLPAPKMLLILAQTTGQFQIDHKRVLDKLWDKLQAFHPDLVVIDGWGWFVCQKESDADYVRPAMAWIKKLRQGLGCATIIIHHFKKTQFTSGQPTGDVDILDRISGLKRLVDQAQTALVYTPIVGYDTFNLLNGRTNKPAWDPPKTVIDYDHTTLTHKALSSEEGQDMFDPDMFRELWGKESTESRRVKGMLNTIRNRNDWNQNQLAEALGVDKSQVSRWYSGRQNPSANVMARLAKEYQKAKEKPLKSAKMPKVRQ